MRLIGYFDENLTIAEIQEIKVAKPIWDPPEDYHRYIIEARASSGAGTRIYKICPIEAQEHGAHYWNTKEEANKVLDSLLTNIDTIDLRQHEDFYCTINGELSTVLIENAWDEFEDQERPIIVKLAE